MLAIKDFQVRNERKDEADALLQGLAADNFNEARAGDLPVWEAAVHVYEEAPLSMNLGFLRDGRLRLRQAIRLSFSYESGQVVAEAEGLDEYGSGANLSEAIADLQHALAELYFALEEQQDRLAAGLQRIWEELRTKIAKK